VRHNVVLGNIIKKIKSDNTYPKILYFRGSKLNNDLSPSLYRNSFYSEKEHIINNRIIQSMPNDFNNCSSFLDKLTILKRFNCPSRLLDITKNPLTAAFFSLDKYNEDKTSDYGTINLCAPTNFDTIKNSQNSDSISLLSALCTTNKKLVPFNQELLQSLIEKIKLELEQTNINFNKLFNYFSEITDLASEGIEMFQQTNTHKNLLKQLTILVKHCKKINKSKKEYFKNNKFKILQILNDINTETFSKNFFYTELKHQMSLMNFALNLFPPQKKDINQYYIVNPSLNNNRIRNQEGLFIFIGANLNKDGYFLNPNEDYLNLFKINNNKRIIFIINNEKDKFYHDLNQLFGINKSFIYPELEKKVNQIKNDVMLEYGIEIDKE